MGSKKEDGFTLIELMVVIAILAVLLAIMATPIVRAKRYAMLAVCQTNLRSVYAANQLYLTDHDFHKPEFKAWETTSGEYSIVFAGTTTRRDGVIMGQGRVISQYLDNNIEVLLCPAVTIKGDRERDRANWADGVSDAGSSYLYEWMHPAGLSFTTTQTLEDLRESWRFNNEPGSTALITDLNVMEIPGLNEPFLAHRYLKKCNILFGDGAVIDYDHDDGTLAARWAVPDIIDLFDNLHSLR